MSLLFRAWRRGRPPPPREGARHDVGASFQPPAWRQAGAASGLGKAPAEGVATQIDGERAPD